MPAARRSATKRRELMRIPRLWSGNAPEHAIRVPTGPRAETATRPRAPRARHRPTPKCLARESLAGDARGSPQAPRVSVGVPATPDIVHELQSTRWGHETVWDILVNAGVRMTENAGCAACLGGPVDTFGRINQPGLKCISATNRNFPGRMGDKESQVFLASPATVAATVAVSPSAAAGRYSCAMT